MNQYIIDENQLSAIEMILKQSGIIIKRNVLLSEIRNNVYNPHFACIEHKVWKHCPEQIRKDEREKMLKVLREQHDVFQSELDDEDNPFSISYRQGKENGLRIAILEVESRQSKDGEP